VECEVFKLAYNSSQILKLPGVDLSKTDQLNRLEALKKQLSMKKDLLEKYRGMCTFDSHQDGF
jgi:mediator of RNA polymerase II transcription subunit 9